MQQKLIIAVKKSSLYVLLYLYLKSLCDHVKHKLKQIQQKRSSVMQTVIISPCWMLTTLSLWKEWTTTGHGKTFWIVELSNKLPTLGINSLTWLLDKTWTSEARQRQIQSISIISRSVYCLGSTCKLQVWREGVIIWLLKMSKLLQFIQVRY